MGSYYYLVAQLPTLSFGAQPPMSPAAFMELCKNFLSDTDTILLDSCNLDPDPYPADTDHPAYSEPIHPGGSDFIDAWRNWERSLRLHLAQQRSLSLKRDSTKIADAPSDPLDAIAVAKSAMNYESPLEAELFLLQSRWKTIEELQGFDYFSRESVYAYLLKLYLLERKSCFTLEEGFNEYKELYASIMDAAPTSIHNGEPT